jgi:hypothetical protein
MSGATEPTSATAGSEPILATTTALPRGAGVGRPGARSATPGGRRHPLDDNGRERRRDLSLVPGKELEALNRAEGRRTPPARARARPASRPSRSGSRHHGESSTSPTVDAAVIAPAWAGPVKVFDTSVSEYAADTPADWC